MDQESWEPLEVEMQSMFILIQLCSHAFRVGQPFTFAFEQAGTNCGLAGKNAVVEVDGAAYWLSENGFFKYAGSLESLPCLVEDHVYDDINLDSGNQMISAGLNNLFGEIMWFYPTSTSSVVNRMVCYNYFDSSPQRPVWTIGTLARTAWQDSAVFGKPHALEYDADGVETSYIDLCTRKHGRYLNILSTRNGNRSS